MDAATIVKRVRAQSGITRKELAELADLSPSTIGRIEQGKLDPTWGSLSRILEATGFQISGETVVSAGDSTAIVAARSVLDSILKPYDTAMLTAASNALVPLTATLYESTRMVPSLANRISTVAQTALAPTVSTTVDVLAEATTQWLKRWARAGWLSDNANADDVVTLAIAAGNAAKLSRRNVSRRFVTVDGGWRGLAQRLGEANIDYAVSGLVASRDDRATATALRPLIYVADPSRVVADLDLDEGKPGVGVQLMAASGDELSAIEVEDGVRFVSRVQGVLDAFAGAGREPDKAEDTLRSLLAVTT